MLGEDRGGGAVCFAVPHDGAAGGLRRRGRAFLHLWSEMIRAIDTLRPPQVVIENVRALLTTPANRTPTIKVCSATSSGTPKPANGWCESSPTGKSCTAVCTQTSSTPSPPPTASALTPPNCDATSGCSRPATAAATPNIFPTDAPSNGANSPAHATRSVVGSGAEIR